MQDCAHNEHKLISILQHFEGLCVLEVDNFVQVLNNHFLRLVW